MWDETILLHIKRQFTENEAVQQLLKMVSELETEIGILKSEVAEAQDKAERIRLERTMTKKQWMQEEVFKETAHELEIAKKKSMEYKRGLEDWRNKYFHLLASQTKNHA